jgi:hypothetical protein
VLNALPQAARVALEEMMRSGTYEYQSDFARKYYGQGLAKGEAKGEAKGKAESILTILENRGIDLSPAQRETILACRDLEQLDRWLRRSLNISTAPELFD